MLIAKVEIATENKVLIYLGYQECWIRHQNQQSALQKRLSSDVGELGEEGSDDAHEGSNEETGGKDANKVQDGFQDVPVSVDTILSLGGHTTGNTFLVIFQSFNKNNCNSIIENWLSKHQCMKVHIHIKVRENCWK